MAKSKSKSSPIRHITFWFVLGLFIVWWGSTLVNGAVNITDTSGANWGIFALILGGMILGVALNKYSAISRENNGKSKK